MTHKICGGAVQADWTETRIYENAIIPKFRCQRCGDEILDSAEIDAVPLSTEEPHLSSAMGELAKLNNINDHASIRDILARLIHADRKRIIVALKICLEFLEEECDYNPEDSPP